MMLRKNVCILFAAGFAAFTVLPTSLLAKPSAIRSFTDSTISAADNNGPVKVVGRRLMVDFDRNGVYESFFIKGTGYSPMPIGRHPSDWGWPVGDPRMNNTLDDQFILNRDFTLLQNMRVNTIRIWKGNDTQVGVRYPIKLVGRTLDMAEQYGIKVIAGFWVDGGMPNCVNGQRIYYTPDFTNQTVRNDLKTRFVNYVNAFKNHPAILFWAIGNENNYFLNPNDPNQIKAWYSLVNEMALAAHQAEGPNYHPVAVVNGDLGYIGTPSLETDDAHMTALDIWGANVYRGNTFGNLFVEYVNKSSKPFWVAEFGVDAWFTQNHQIPDIGYEDQALQAQINGNLWDDLIRFRTATIGGTLMEYSDEWWKPYEWINNGQHNSQQNHFGTGPIDTNCPPDGVADWYPPMPDQFINDEWWGVMSIAPNPSNPQGPDVMTPRQVYTAMAHRFECSDAIGAYYAGPENNKSCDLSHACCTKAAFKSKGGRCVLACSRIVIEPVRDRMKTLIKTIIEMIKESFLGSRLK